MPRLNDFLSKQKNKLSPAGITIPLYPIVLFLIILIDKLFFLVSKGSFLKENGFPPFEIIRVVIVEDIGILSLIIFLAIFSKKMNRGSLLVPFIFGLLLFYFLDSQVFQSLYERLTFPKIYEYAHEVSAVASFVSLQKLLAVAGILIHMWFFRRISLNFSNKAGFIILTCAVTGAIMPYVNLSGRPFDLFFDGATANVLRINQRLVLDQSVKIDVLLKARRTFPDLTEKFDEFYSGK